MRKTGRVAAGVIAVAILVQACHPGRPVSAGRQVPGTGSSFTAADASGDIYRVTLVKVIDPARRAGVLGAVPGSGSRFVAAVFTVRALHGVPRGENAAADAVVVGSDGAQYTSVREPVAGYAAFGSGPLSVAGGAAVTGAVLFEVTRGVRVAGIEWTGGALTGTVRWRVAS